MHSVKQLHWTPSTLLLSACVDETRLNAGFNFKYFALLGTILVRIPQLHPKEFVRKKT